MGTKITIELPEWAEKRHIYIMAGIEELAVKKAYSNELLIKTVQCNHCGECCKNIDRPETFPFPVVDGHCAYLKIYTDGKTDCGRGIAMPFSCSVEIPNLTKWDKGHLCCIEHKKELLNDV